MKKTNYETPEILLIQVTGEDVISTSQGDTPMIDVFDSYDW